MFRTLHDDNGGTGREEWIDQSSMSCEKETVREMDERTRSMKGEVRSSEWSDELDDSDEKTKVAFEGVNDYCELLHHTFSGMA